ncbi:cation:proton antiporter [Marinilabilia sp.]|uniref:cation:proton antiporter n=1 Tax=Marinilabilia sp. TaxID=2021252 RepID=UPI0025C13B5D|nr:cation:proton antiporter [Marinilabilia sp.]
MSGITLIGIILISGFIFGELINKLNLPKVSGYIIAGILLSPPIAPFVSESFVESTKIVTNLSLSIITFSVGGTLLISKIKNQGRQILKITLGESSFAFLFVMIGFILLSPFLIKIDNATYVTIYIPLSLMLGALAAPTDPTATLAVAHEYKAKGNVMSTIMGVAAFDDALGLFLFSIAIAIATPFVSSQDIEISAVTLSVVKQILGAILIGGIAGYIFNIVAKHLSENSEGMMIVVTIGFLALCFGISSYLDIDELLAIMFMGFIVVNFNEKQKLIFILLERYTEQLVFILFFTISGMHLDIFVLGDSFLLILLFVILRASGKFTGVLVGAGNAPKEVKKYTAGGLIPQGGIVIGLALMVKYNPAFSLISDEFINIVLGATVIHELIGPVLAKLSLRKAGEIEK